MKAPVFAIALLLAAAAPAMAQTQILESCSGMSLGANGALNGFVPSPSDAWHTDISAAAVDAASATILSSTTDLGGAVLHADFSSIGGGDYGIPYTVVDSSQTAAIPVAITLYGAESDLTVAPIPSNAGVEGSPAQCTKASGDQHMVVLDRKLCVAYEYWQAAGCNGAWTAANNAVWDMSETEQRPTGFTSADAGGLSVFEGLVRYDEIVAGSIQHAIRFTARYSKSDAHGGYFTAPATHAAGNLATTDNIMGMRLRLKASFDVSGYSATNQIILNAMKKYGMILADNGSNLFFQGTPDARWDDSDLNKLKAVPASAFDVVAMGPVYDAATAPTGKAPVITSFKASATSVAAGTRVTLTAVVSGDSYDFVDKAGFLRGKTVVVAPAATTAYLLTSRNSFGTATASVTVTVATPVNPGLTLALTPTGKATVFTATAASRSGGALTYSIASGPATISGRVVTVTAAGTVVVEATQAATGTYTAATAKASTTVAANVFAKKR